MMKFSSVEHKLLLAFAAFLLVVTVLNAGLAAYLIDREGEAEAFTRLSRQLEYFKKDLQASREAQLSVAVDATRDEKNLSDMAILYGQSLKLDKEPGETLDSTLSLNRITSLNRLQLILLSARISSAAVYLEGGLSHYVTRDGAGMMVQRSGKPTLTGVRQKEGGRIQLTDWRSWSEVPPPILIARNLPVVDQATVAFDFPTAQMMVMHVIVPIQATPRESFGETIVEDVTVATTETTPAAGDKKPVVIGMFVFSKVFDTSFLEETASKTGMIPAVFSPDGQHHAQLVEVGAPSEAVLSQNNSPIRLQTVNVGSASYYQAFIPWQVEAGGPALTLGMALSRGNTLITIRQTVAGIIVVAASVLLLGGAVGYVLVKRLVAPIKALAATVARTVLRPQGEGLDPHAMQITSDQLAEINLGAGDEVARLTTAFNVMTGQLHQTLETLEQRVAERTAQLEEANKELEAFSYSVSHDLRAPLRHIDGFLGLLKERIATALDEQSQHHIDTISKAARRMGMLIDDLLSFSRMGRKELTQSPVDLGTLVQDVINEFEPEATGRAIDWRVDELPVVIGDRAMLRIVLVNLISNALKFTQPRAQTEIVIGSLPGHETECIVFVRDNGVGFDKRYADKLFGVFERLHGFEEFEGTGIGLANVHRIISRHGGRTWAEGEVDGGATFYFLLPLTLPA